MDDFLDTLDAVIFYGFICAITFGGLYFAGQIQQSHRDAVQQVTQAK
jgi:hypothetical protein